MTRAAAKEHAPGRCRPASLVRIAGLLGIIGVLTMTSRGVADAQSLTILPVNIEMAPGQMASTLTVINHGDGETSVQVRLFAWSQASGDEQLSPSEDVLASPPICTIPAGGSQVIRLVLRRPPQQREATYRILLDQIPPAASSGTVRVALRLSIPIFAQPATRALPHVQFHIERTGGESWLVAVNDGSRHEKISDIAVTTSTGRGLSFGDASPYVLAGATSRRRINTPADLIEPGGLLHLTAQADTGVVDEPVSVVADP